MQRLFPALQQQQKPLLAGPEVETALKRRLGWFKRWMIFLIIAAVLAGLVLVATNLGLTAKGGGSTTMTLSSLCSDNNGATLDYMTANGCVSLYSGAGTGCEDACSIDGTGVASMNADGEPECMGRCIGTCNQTAYYYYYAVNGTGCPNITWSQLMTVNESSLIQPTQCFTNVCIYLVFWPDELAYLLNFYESGGHGIVFYDDQGIDLCMSLIDKDYPLRDCIAATPSTTGCKYVFSCAEVETDTLAVGPYWGQYGPDP
jgi:hypothetical protein